MEPRILAFILKLGLNDYFSEKHSSLFLPNNKRGRGKRFIRVTRTNVSMFVDAKIVSQTKLPTYPFATPVAVL
jgi:hypothetical protein